MQVNMYFMAVLLTVAIPIACGTSSESRMDDNRPIWLSRPYRSDRYVGIGLAKTKEEAKKQAIASLQENVFSANRVCNFDDRKSINEAASRYEADLRSAQRLQDADIAGLSYEYWQDPKTGEWYAYSKTKKSTIDDRIEKVREKSYTDFGIIVEYAQPSPPKKREDRTVEVSSESFDDILDDAPSSRKRLPDTLARRTVHSVIIRGLPNLGICTKEQARRDTDLVGKEVTLGFIISRNGRCSGVFLEPESVKSKYLESCIKREVESWQYPKFTGEGIRVKLPLPLNTD